MVPLIGAVTTCAPRRRRKSSGREARDPAAGRGEGGRVRRRDRLERPRRAGRAADRRERAVEAQADVGLEDLAGGDPLAAVGDRIEVVLGGGGGEPQRLGRDVVAQRPARCGGDRAAQPARRSSSGRARGLGDERLEPPPPWPGRAAGRCRSRRGGTRAAAPGAAARPAALDPGGRAGSRASRTSRRRPRPDGRRSRAGGRRQPVEHRERIVARRSATRSGSEPTIAPPPAQLPVSANGSGWSRSAASSLHRRQRAASGTRCSARDRRRLGLAVHRGQ